LAAVNSNVRLNESNQLTAEFVDHCRLGSATTSHMWRYMY